MKPGDKVQWTHVGGSRRTFSMSLREGVIVTLGVDTAVVQKRSGKMETVALDRLSLIGEPTLLSRTVEAIREGGRS